ncbi:MAG: hypothetical protein HY746_04570 [Elusimicrobia bacterium]|nr:hypothetical protein [Elusimicrobiota bacterium]
MMKFLAAAFVLSACLGSAEAGEPYNTIVSTQVLRVEQIYRPVVYRDPLVQSTVYGDAKSKAAPEANAVEIAKSTFTVYDLELTGLMEDSKGKQAMLIFILKAGRLFDGKKNTVKGITGIIRGKQVVLMTEDKKVVPLNFQEQEIP